MGRTKTPSEVHRAKGSYAKNPQRENKNEPKASKLTPKMPSSLRGDKVAVAKWKQLCKWLGDLGLLTETDTDLMEAYCETYSRKVQALKDSRGCIALEGKNGPIRNPVSVEYHKCEDRLVKLRAEMGLTPASRAGLKAAPKEEENGFDAYLRSLTSKN